VRQDQGDAVLAQLGEHVRQGQRGEGIELIEVQVEVRAALLRHVGPGKGREPQGGHEERPQKRRWPLAQLPLGEVYDQYLPLIYDPSQVKGAVSPCEDGLEGGIGEKGGDLVEERGCHHGTEGGAISLVLVSPEGAHLLVGDRGDDIPPPVAIRKEPRDVYPGTRLESQGG